MIPEAAVEAAAKAAYEVMPVELFGEDRPVTWEQLSDSILGRVRKDHELSRARAALEAAAPHMLAEIKSGIDAELQDAPIANYEENNYEAGYVAGLAFALETMQAIK